MQDEQIHEYEDFVDSARGGACAWPMVLFLSNQKVEDSNFKLGDVIILYFFHDCFKFFMSLVIDIMWPIS